MTHAKQMSSLALALVIALALAVMVFTPALAGGIEPPHSQAAPLAHPPYQDPTPTPPPPPDPIINNIFNTIQFPFVNLVEALQNAIQVILRRAIEPIQMMFESVLSLWLQNPGILSSGNAALPGWDLIRDAWQFMYSIAVAFWPLTLAIVAAIAAKDAVAASTWGLGDLKQALGTWLVAVLLSATSLWWMDLANNLTNAITSYVLYNFAGPQFFPGTFMVFFSTVLPGLFLAFPLAGIIIIMFLLILAITIFIGLTFAVIARLVLVYLLVALGPLAIILGVLPPLRFVTHLWTRGFLLVLALGPVNALLLKMAFNVAQYASSAPAVQAAAAFVGVFGLLSILITINFAVVKGVFGAVIAVAQQTMNAVKTVGQMVVAGALLMSGAGAGAGVAMGGGAVGGAAGGGAGGSGGSGGLGGAALGAAGAVGGSAGSNGGGMPITAPNAVGANENGRARWRPSGRGMAAAGNYLQSTRGPLAGFGALLRAAGIDRMSQERTEMLGANGDGANPEQQLGLAAAGGALDEGETALGQLKSGRETGERETGSGTLGYTEAARAMGGASGALGTGTAASQIGESARQIEGNARANAKGLGSGTGTSQLRLGTGGERRKVGDPTTGGIGAGAVVGGIGAPPSSGALSARASASMSASANLGAQEGAKQVTGGSRALSGVSGTGAAVSSNRALGQDAGASAPPRHANTDSIAESRAAMGFDNKIAAAGQLGGGAAVPSQLDVGATDSIPAASALGEIGTAGAIGEPRAAAELTAGERSEVGAHKVEEGLGVSGMDTETFEPALMDSSHTPYETPALAPEADRTLSMLPIGSEDARFQAAQLASRYEPAQQGNVAMSLEHAMRTANEQHGIGWTSMGEAMERGLWSTHEAANNGIPLQEMARQMEPFSGTRDLGEYLAWQLTGGSEQFHLPAQQVAHLPAAGPYDYQAGRYVEQQLGGAVTYPEAAQLFYVIRDPSTPGGGWSKGQQFISEVNRVSRMQGGNQLAELDRWMQTNAPTRARMLWNIHFKVVNS